MESSGRMNLKQIKVLLFGASGVAVSRAHLGDPQILDLSARY